MEWGLECFEGGGIVVILCSDVSISRAKNVIDLGCVPVRSHCGIPPVVVSVSELVSAGVPRNGKAEGRQ